MKKFRRWGKLFDYLEGMYKYQSLALMIRLANRYGVICSGKILLYAPPEKVREFKLQARRRLLWSVRKEHPEKIRTFYKEKLKAITLPELPTYCLKVKTKGEISSDRLNEHLAEFIQSIYPNAKFYIEKDDHPIFKSRIVVIKNSDKTVGATVVKVD